MPLRTGRHCKIVFRSLSFGRYTRKSWTVLRVVSGSQHTARLAVGPVAELDGVSVHPVIDALAFLAALPIPLQLSAEGGGEGFGMLHFPAEVAHHVGAGKPQQAVPHQQGHPPPGKIRNGAQAGALYAIPREKSAGCFMDQVCALTS